MVTTRRDARDQHRGATLQGSANPNARSDHRLVPLRHDQPGHLQRHLRHARAGERRHRARRAATTPVAYSQAITGLTAGDDVLLLRDRLERRRHLVRHGAVVHHAARSRRGDDQRPSRCVTGTTATLNGSANPNGAGDDRLVPLRHDQPGHLQRHLRHARAGERRHRARRRRDARVAYSQAISGSSPATTYYFCAIASNSEGTSFGAVLTFTTPAAPAVDHDGRDDASPNTSATLNGSANPNGSRRRAGSATPPPTPAPATTPSARARRRAAARRSASGSTPWPTRSRSRACRAGTTYYYCAIASNSAGTGVRRGAVVHDAGAAVGDDLGGDARRRPRTATLNGSANPERQRPRRLVPLRDDRTRARATTRSARAHLRPVGTLSAPAPRAVAYSQPISGLTPGTTYYYCAIANNALRERRSARCCRSRRSATAPTVTTNAATLLTGTTATLNGTANPGGDTTTGWFRYATDQPGLVQRHVRHARARGRRLRARHRHRRGRRTRRRSRA